MQEPSPVKSVVKKVVACLACAYIYMRFISVYPIKNIKGELNILLNIENVFQLDFRSQMKRFWKATTSCTYYGT